jgi:hypothetical protein
MLRYNYIPGLLWRQYRGTGRWRAWSDHSVPGRRQDRTGTDARVHCHHAESLQWREHGGHFATQIKCIFRLHISLPKLCPSTSPSSPPSLTLRQRRHKGSTPEGEVRRARLHPQQFCSPAAHRRRWAGSTGQRGRGHPPVPGVGCGQRSMEPDTRDAACSQTG